MADEIKNETNVFVGRRLHKTGEDKNKNKWKMFKTFWGDPERPLTRNMFEKDTTKGIKATELVEGQEYSYGYTEYNGTLPDGNEYTSKTIIFVKNKEDSKPKMSFGKPQETVADANKEAGIDVPAELRGWLNTLKENKEDFKGAFSNNYDGFVQWIRSAPDCGTDYYVNKSDVEIKALYEELNTKL